MKVGADLGANSLQNIVQRRLSNSLDFGVGAVLNGVGNKDSGRLKAEGVGLRLGRFDKFGGGDKDGRQVALFQFVGVMHTARRTGTSICQGFDDHLTFSGNG